MKQLAALLAVAAMVVGLSGVAFGYPGHPTYYAVYIPDDKLPTLDGDFSDWAWIADEYLITTDMMTDVTGAEFPTADDLTTFIYVGWNDKTNRMYIGARVIDDVHTVDHEPWDYGAWRDDSLEFNVNASNDGTLNYKKGETDRAYHIYFAGPLPEGELGEYWSENTWYAPQPDKPKSPYIDYGFSRNEATKETIYEVSFVLFDYREDESSDPAILHDLSEGETIGLTIAINDTEQPGDIRENQLSTTDVDGSYRDGNVLSNFVLSPIVVTAVEASQWGAVKALFR